MTLLSVCGRSVRGMVVVTATTIAMSGTTVALSGWAEDTPGVPEMPGTASSVARSGQAGPPVSGAALAFRSAGVQVAAQQAAAQKVAAQKAAAKKAAAKKSAATKARVAAAAGKKRAAAARDASGTRASRSAARTGSPRTVARAMVADRGWSTAQFSCLDGLWERESGWRVRAQNPGSGAYGIPQALPGRKMASAGRDWRTSADTQIEWGLDYIADRYGSPCRAASAARGQGWY